MSATPPPSTLPRFETDNSEWRLCDFVNALGAELDCAEDALSLKSYGRDVSFALNKLSLDVAVSARVDGRGRVLFRTAEPGDTGATVLKLDLAQMLRSQLEDARKPLDENVDSRPLSMLEGMTREDLDAFADLAVFTLEDLRRVARTPAMVVELARQTGLAEIRIRRWLDLPYLLDLAPDHGTAGDIVTIRGRKLGERSTASMVLFGDCPAPILEWAEHRIAVEVPEGSPVSPVVAIVDGVASNALRWSIRSPEAALGGDQEVTAGDPVVLDGSASRAFGGREIIRFFWTLVESSTENNREGLVMSESAIETEKRKAVAFVPGRTVVTTESTVWAVADAGGAPLPAGRHVFQLIVEDDAGNKSQPATAVVIVKDTQRPTAVLKGPDQVQLGESFPLDGSQSSDVPPGKVASYYWTLMLPSAS
jgi:IPT/TIG domain